MEKASGGTTLAPTSIIMLEEDTALGDVVEYEEIANNSINSTMVPFLRNDKLAMAEIGILITIFIVALGSNAFVLFLMRKRNQMTRMHWFIVHLCIADILVAVFNVFPQLMWKVYFPFQGGAFLCKLVPYLQLLVIYLSAYILIMTAIDRYVAICHTMVSRTWSNNRTHILVGIAWIIAVLLATPQFAIFDWYDDLEHSGAYDHCWASFTPQEMWKAYVLFFFTVVYAVPFLILAFCYGSICYTVCTNVRWRQLSAKKKKINSSTHSSKRAVPTSASSGNSKTLLRIHSNNDFSRAKIKTAKLSAVVMFVYLLCWLPYFVTHLWGIDETQPPRYIMHPLAVVANLLASLNSCCNPWIYFAFTGCECKRTNNSKIRNAFNKRATFRSDLFSEESVQRTRSLCLSKSNGNGTGNHGDSNNSSNDSPKRVPVTNHNGRADRSVSVGTVSSVLTAKLSQCSIESASFDSKQNSPLKKQKYMEEEFITEDGEAVPLMSWDTKSCGNSALNDNNNKIIK